MFQIYVDPEPGMPPRHKPLHVYPLSEYDVAPTTTPAPATVQTPGQEHAAGGGA